ncbi:unnamed protein product [Vitrella brassicaformis CCMP3155]|uniref:Uncharacterized protein n=1 Tax=Vitrella brassicaformis (strain CCMP3155) TaxID=1169540 RepID=A0A0G4ER77_VITBC|nr:unnamed protein product [Vitrella brassicaformis CCMP3155]|mmetsp:Transcript_19442/g.46985  ORF Transcript_19442/g.46985 Transcript_19442/m.46985 type:complete len:714 (-) Transcript_19442:458-2599(-)|eukprot:CEL99957.1 unnamed protein product [Vitrella brassicaformis CCMP3155]
MQRAAQDASASFERVLNRLDVTTTGLGAGGPGGESDDRAAAGRYGPSPPGGFADKFADKDGFECPLGIGGGVGGVMHPAMQQMAGGSGAHGVMLMGDPYAGRKDITRGVAATAAPTNLLAFAADHPHAHGKLRRPSGECVCGPSLASEGYGYEYLSDVPHMRHSTDPLSLASKAKRDIVQRGVSEGQTGTGYSFWQGKDDPAGAPSAAAGSGVTQRFKKDTHTLCALPSSRVGGAGFPLLPGHTVKCRLARESGVDEYLLANKVADHLYRSHDQGAGDYCAMIKCHAKHLQLTSLVFVDFLPLVLCLAFYPSTCQTSGHDGHEDSHTDLDKSDMSKTDTKDSDVVVAEIQRISGDPVLFLRVWREIAGLLQATAPLDAPSAVQLQHEEAQGTQTTQATSEMDVCVGMGMGMAIEGGFGGIEGGDFWGKVDIEEVERAMYEELEQSTAVPSDLSSTSTPTSSPSVASMNLLKEGLKEPESHPGLEKLCSGSPSDMEEGAALIAQSSAHWLSKSLLASPDALSKLKRALDSYHDTHVGAMPLTVVYPLVAAVNNLATEYSQELLSCGLADTLVSLLKKSTHTVQSAPALYTAAAQSTHHTHTTTTTVTRTSFTQETITSTMMAASFHTSSSSMYTDVCVGGVGGVAELEPPVVVREMAKAIRDLCKAPYVESNLLESLHTSIRDLESTVSYGRSFDHVALQHVRAAMHALRGHLA